TGIVATPARAATCVNVPGSTPGTNVTILGDVYRIPEVPNVAVCVGDGSVPFVGVETSGGSCTAACLAVLLRGSDVESGGVTVSYQLDGFPRSHTVDPGGVGGPGDSCVFGVGSPVAPRSDCLFAVEPDLQDLVDTVNRTVDDAVTLVNDAVADVEEAVEDVEQAVDDALEDVGALEDQACDAVPSMEDPNPDNHHRVEFCDDPVLWLEYTSRRVDQLLSDLEPLVLACRAIENATNDQVVCAF
ncbi:MAG TPA: hypothetical protein VHJ76_02590, partial [Actinomycetota bacterium]|nr:hypothetical protein [Actinomycetota bacterium]